MEEGEPIDCAVLLLINRDEPNGHTEFLAQPQQVLNLVHSDADRYADRAERG